MMMMMMMMMMITKGLPKDDTKFQRDNSSFTSELIYSREG